MFYSNAFWSVLASITIRIIISKGYVVVVSPYNFLNTIFYFYFKFYEIPSNQTKIEGEKVKFDCKTSFSENVTIRWYREMVPVVNSQTNITITKSGSLILNEAIADDSGKYICEIYDNFGLVGRAEAFLNVECWFN